MSRDIDLGAELRTWRKLRGFSLRQLAQVLMCDHSRVWKIENGRILMTREIAVACDAALVTGGTLVAAWSAARGQLRPAQLPAAPPALVGRAAELAVLTASDRELPPGTPAVVAIDGPAGVGKTALALRWAHQVAARYVDGQLYADLRGFAPVAHRQGVTPRVVLEQFLMALGVTTMPDSARECAALFRSLTADRKVLVVLDNVGSIKEIEPLLPASAGSGVVVTSRHALSGLVGIVGATCLTLRAVTESDAITLVRQVIGADRADMETEAVTALARLCGHLPLALHAAAAQIAIYPHRQVASLVNELAEENHLLCLGAMGDLATVFSWSYHKLDAATARLFRLLSLHPGTHVSVAATAALVGVTISQARRSVHYLAALHLVEIDAHGLIHLNAVILAYARQLVHAEETDSERSAAAQRMVTWYVRTAERARDLIADDVAGASPGAIRRPVAQELAPERSVTGARGEILADGVRPVDFPDRASALAWWEMEVTNFCAVTTLALDYGLPGTTHQLATETENMGPLYHSSPPTPRRGDFSQHSPHHLSPRECVGALQGESGGGMEANGAKSGSR